MSVDTCVQVIIRHGAIKLRVLSEMASKSYEEVKKNLIDKCYEGNAAYYAANSAGDAYHEELRFLNFVARQYAFGDDTGVLAWGMLHKNCLITDFIEHLTPFWKAYFSLTTHWMPDNILVMETATEDEVAQYCVGRPYGDVAVDAVVYRKLDVPFNWRNFEIDFKSAKSI